MLVTIIHKNPKAIEAAINLAAMFIHFHKHSKFVIDLTKKEIESIKSNNGDKFNQIDLTDNINSKSIIKQDLSSINS